MDTIDYNKYIRPRNTKLHSVSVSAPKKQSHRANRSCSMNTSSKIIKSQSDISISAEIESNKKYFDYVSKNNYSIDEYELIKYPAGNNFCNWLNIVCDAFNIIFTELEPAKNYRQISIGNKSSSKIVCIDWEYLNIHMIHVVSNIISSRYNYNIDIIEFPTNFAVKLIPSLNYEYEIEINQLSDIYVRKENIQLPIASICINKCFIGRVFKEAESDIIPHFYVI